MYREEPIAGFTRNAMIARFGAGSSPAADLFETVLDLALEIGREGCEGRRVGAIFTLGRGDTILRHSRPLILDPLAGHPRSVTHISNASMRSTVKQLSQLDGAFVIDDDGVVVGACRYLVSDVSRVALPLGLGSRHFAAAGVSGAHGIAAIVVSASGIVRVFEEGALIGDVADHWLRPTAVV